MVTKLKFHTPTADSTNKSSTKHTCALFIIVLEKDDTDPSHQRLYFSAKLMTEKNCLLIRITRLHKGAFSAILRDIKCTVRKGVQSGNESDLPRFVMNLFCVLHKRVFAQNYILQSMFFFFFLPQALSCFCFTFLPSKQWIFLLSFKYLEDEDSTNCALFSKSCDVAKQKLPNHFHKG